MKDPVLGFPGGTSGKEPACQCRRHQSWVWSLSQEDPWRRAWQPTPVFLPGESHGQRSLMGYNVGHGVTELDTTEWLSLSLVQAKIPRRHWLDLLTFGWTICCHVWVPYLISSPDQNTVSTGPVWHHQWDTRTSTDQAGRCPELGVGAGVGIRISAPHRLTPSLSCVCLLCPLKIDDRQRIHRAPPLQSSSE